MRYLVCLKQVPDSTVKVAERRGEEEGAPPRGR